MSEHQEQVEELVQQAGELGHGRTQVALLEQAVRIADAHNDLDLAYETRNELLRSAVFSGVADVALVAFSWCLSQHDRHPERFDTDELLWRYKWVVAHLTDFPHVTLAQMQDMLADMERRFRAAGSTLHAVWEQRRELAVFTGDRETAERAHAEFLKTPRDHLSNCAACVADATIEFQVFRGDDEAALKAANKILDGHMSCGEVPHRTYAVVAGILFRLGRVKEALDSHRKGYRMIQDNPKFVRHWGMHLMVLTLTDNLDRGVKLVEKSFPSALATVSLSWQFEFVRALRFLLTRLKAKGEETLSLRVGKEFALHRPDGKYPIAELATWCDSRLDDLATQFDVRNGNDMFRRRLAELEQLPALVKKLEVPPGKTWKPSPG
jgi:hypothetical protein